MQGLTQSQEDYLEAIFMVRKEKGSCLLIDVAYQLAVTKSSTSVALKKLETGGYIYRKDNDICLTRIGAEIAAEILDRHIFFTKALIEMGVSETVAAHDACLIKHRISDETYQKVKSCCKNKSQAVC